MVIADLIVVWTILSGLGRGGSYRKGNRSTLGDEDSLGTHHANPAGRKREALLEFGEGDDIAIDVPQVAQPRECSHSHEAIARAVHRTRTVDDVTAAVSCLRGGSDPITLQVVLSLEG
jgi:hypothetical protein